MWKRCSSSISRVTRSARITLTNRDHQDMSPP
jgi:hypothetical protein